ncbi:hypothetical protein PT2222_40018 [Paraburkholderia tropica]
MRILPMHDARAEVAGRASTLFFKPYFTRHA